MVGYKTVSGNGVIFAFSTSHEIVFASIDEFTRSFKPLIRGDNFLHDVRTR